MRNDKAFPLLRAITKKNEGHGATLLYGYHYAIQQGADYIFQTDSDGQTNPEEFHVFWNKRHSYDMVIGYRNKRQDGLARILVTKILRLVISICFGVWVKDANTPFRLMKVSTLKEEMQLIPEKFNLTNVLIAVIYEKKKKKILYLPITFRPRQGGTNSIHMKKICSIGLDAIKDFAVINKSLREVIQKNEY